jgi:chitinase
MLCREYPAADDRSGRKADFDNFPKWMKNLRSQLKSSGKKYGLSLTLPASYWYLQHFDIKKLEDSVDWFNVMSYDMHGTWDMNSTWVGPFINPHTNLTEIKNAMDLLWRNDISPSKVVMGLAYYGRSFTLVDPACAEPGCTYRSGGNSGECSETIGFLLNSEIQNIISEDALTPTFYEEDAVKAIAFGDQWVSFDDEDTFKIRGDYAKSQCMGGVMVWAISHDDRNHTSAKALTSGLGRKRIAFPDYPTSPSTSSTTSSTSARSLTKRDDTEKNIDVCRWTNCGDDCPAGWKWIPRSDSDNLSMTDDTGCFSGFSKLCCPGDVDIPTCKWRGMPKHGGYCTPGCDDDEVEVGTLGAPYCDFRHQSACCTKTPSTEPYGQCKWVGGSPTCSSAGNHHDCPDDYPDFVFASSNGAGGEQTCDTGAKSYCCKKDATPWQFKKCDWKTKETHKFSDFLCEPSCADGWTRLGMQMGSCTFSREAYCCEGDPPEIKKDDDDDSGDDGDDDDTKTSSTIIPRDPEQMYYGQYEKLIDDYMAQPGAPDDWQSSSWSSSGDDNDDEIQLWYKRSILSVASFEYLNSYTARTVDTMLNATTNLWDINGPAPIYGEALYIEAMNQVVADSGYTINTYAYVSDMTANPSTANQGMNYLNTAASDLCEVEEDYEYSSKRDFVEVNNRASLAERHINVLGEYGNAMLFQPTIEDILDGIMNNELTMHYARWEHYADNNRGNRVAQSGPFLEIAYWIGTTIGTLGPNAYRYQETSQDRWVVFHLHTVNVSPLPYYRIGVYLRLICLRIRAHSAIPELPTAPSKASTTSPSTTAKDS